MEFFESPRKKRKELRTSEVNSGPMAIETYIYRCDPYRSTTMHPLPYPLLAKPAEKSIAEKLLGHSNQIWQIIREHGFRFGPQDGTLMVQNLEKPNYPNGNPETVLRVVFTGKVRFPGALGPCRDEICDHLAQIEIDIHVEIVHWEMCFKPHLWPISATDSSVPLYKAARQNLITILHRRLGTAWKGLCLFNMGTSPKRAAPTITVLVQPEKVANWADIALRLATEIRSSDIGVEFLPGDLCFLGDATSQYSRMNVDGLPQMGDSIGVVGEKEGGTLGFLATLKVGEEEHRGFITNHHVVRPAANADPQTVKEASQVGFSFSRQSAHTQVIHFYPDDISESAKEAQTVLDETESQLRRLEWSKEKRLMAEEEIQSSLQLRIDQTNGLVDIAKLKTRAIERMPTSLGKAVLSSGDLMQGSRVIDWAFARFHDEVANLCTAPNRMPDIPVSLRQGITMQWPAGAPLIEFGELVEGEWYCKVGKTTDMTAGFCNGVKFSCNWTGKERNPFDLGGNPIHVDPDVTEEFVFEHSADGVFCMPGDSGSAIIDRFGRICGVVYGATKRYSGPDSISRVGLFAGLGMPIGDMRHTADARAGAATSLTLPG